MSQAIPKRYADFEPALHAAASLATGLTDHVALPAVAGFAAATAAFAGTMAAFIGTVPAVVPVR